MKNQPFQPVSVLDPRLIPYSTSPHEEWIRLPLDRTEPPVPYRASVMPPLNTPSRYPSPGELEAILASNFNRAPEEVIVTAGADEALDRACRALLNDRSQIIITDPSFEMLRHYALLARATVEEVEWLDGAFPFEEICARITPETRIIALISPNNPTGRAIPAEEIKQLALLYPGVIILLDLAYIEFAEHDPTRQLLEFENILITRTFSKAWGLPGLRLGYAIGHHQLIGWLRTAGGPYSVARASIELVADNINGWRPSMLEYVKRIQWERQRLSTMLDEYGIRFIPSDSNFILLFPEDPVQFDRALRTHGIRTRSFESNPLISSARRMTLPGDPKAFQQLEQALEQAAYTLQNTNISIP
jgi:histidinol-phosphate aminotransferase